MLHGKSDNIVIAPIDVFDADHAYPLLDPIPPPRFIKRLVSIDIMSNLLIG